jgi:hypothetical protein
MKKSWWLVFLTFSAFAQDQSELKAIRKLKQDLPSFQTPPKTEEFAETENLYKVPDFPVKFSEINESGTEMGAVRAGVNLINIKDNKPLRLSKDVYLKFYRMQDEHGFRYVVNKDGQTLYRINGDYVTSLRETTEMYVPPLKYSTARVDIVEEEFDRKLHLRPEVVVFAGVVSGQYMRDLFNDDEAQNGQTYHIGANMFTDWSLPLKVGLATHYEVSRYKLSGGGNIDYQSFSLGPQLKTRDFHIFEETFRFQTQFRVSPLASLTAQTTSGSEKLKFNSADVLTSFEVPLKNPFGEAVVSLFYQAQWLNLRGDRPAVSVSSSNAINSSFGLSLGQVF